MTLFNLRDISKNSCSISLAIARRMNRVAKVVTLWAQEQEATIRLFEDYSGEIVNGTKHFGFT